MERFVKGDVVVVNFPFSDLSGFSKRPALVLVDLSGDDIILCQITTKSQRADEYSLTLEEQDFKLGKLPQPSYIRLNKIFTASKKVFLKKVGTINSKKLSMVENKFTLMIKK